ncbi:MAG TPA: VCBS repeat-containing protein [Geobacteraceae bacterium]
MITTAYRQCRRILAAAVTGLLLLGGTGCSDHNDSSPPVVAIRQSGIVAADFNGDGRPDMAVSASLLTGAVASPGEVQLFIQDPLNPGFFLPQFSIPVGTDPAQLAAADLNGDRVPDLAVANESADSVSVLLNSTFQPGNFVSVFDYPCGPAPLAVAIGDLNRDGRPDLAVAVADGIDILLQDPLTPGTFRLPLHLNLVGGSFGVAIGDLDGDGFNDIAAAGQTTVQVFFQNPLTPGGFFLPESFAAGLRPNALAIADFDRDGLLDVAVANLGDSLNGSNASVSILFQDPVVAGNFLPARNLAAPNGTRHLAIGDLNNDGLPDIAAAFLQAPNQGGVAVYLQTLAQPGNLQLVATYPNGFGLQALAVADLDNDGRLDIATQDGPSIFFQDPLRPGSFFNEVLIGP